MTTLTSSALFRVQAALRQEDRDLLQSVRASLNIGWPGPYEERSEERKTVSAISALVNSAGRVGEDGAHRGEWFGPELIDRAIACMEQQVEVTQREADIEHWRKDIPADIEPPVEGRPETFAGNPHYMASVLAEARQVQFREASEALNMLRRVRLDLDYLQGTLPLDEDAQPT